MTDSVEDESVSERMAQALAEIAGIASQRGTDRAMFSLADTTRLGTIERLARKVLANRG